MVGRWLVSLLVPLALAGGLTACEQGGVQQGVVKSIGATRAVRYVLQIKGL